MKKRQYISSEFKELRFPEEDFDKSCLIYTKNNYGIFLVTSRDGQVYTIKVNAYLRVPSFEIENALYIKEKVGNMPNLLLPEAIYVGRNPSSYSLFREEKNRLKLKECKNANLREIFNENLSHSYYVTKACLYNLGYYLGANKGTLTYKAFVAFSFQILAALLSLHNINVWHRDIKTQNILICKSDIAKSYSSISYIGKEGKVWTIDYADTDGRDVKIIDYGESLIEKEVKNPCTEFDFEVTVATVSVLNFMWSKVTDKLGKEGEYNELINLLKNCKTSIYDVLQNARIFEGLLYSDERSYKVDLF
jgi:serine/threonine protein kinase